MSLDSIFELFDRAAERYPKNIAVESRYEQLDYRGLWERSNNLANFLNRAVTRGSLVGVMVEDPIELIVAMLGTMRAGCVYVPLDSEMPEARLSALVSEVLPRWFIVGSKQVDLLSKIVPPDDFKATFICTDNERDYPGSHTNLVRLADYVDYFNPARPEVDLEQDGMCYIYFTSGSTGKPKGIAGRLKSVDHFIDWEIKLLGIDQSVRVSQLTRPSFDAFLRDVFVPLCVGGTVCIPPDRETLLDSRSLCDWIDLEGVSIVHCVPTLFRSILSEQLSPGYFESLRYVLLAGEVLLPADVKAWTDTFDGRIQLINLYGPTETTMTKFFYFVKPTDKDRLSIPVGRPMAGARAVVIGSDGAPCPAKVIGEIYIRTPYRSLGYYNQPDLTREVFVPNPFNDDPNDLVYKTGDLGRVLDDGNYEFLGRKDDQVKIRGVRIELREIEDLLRRHEAIRDVAVVDREDGGGQKYLCAYVVLKKQVAQAQLREYLAGYLPQYMVPSHVVLMEQLPKTTTGKVDRRALPNPEEARNKREGERVTPRTPIEELIAGIWGEVIDVGELSVEDDFFDLGGHSLLATQVISRVRDALQVEVPLRALFESPTVAGLAEVVERERRAGRSVEAPPIRPVNRSRSLPLSFAQQRLWFIHQLAPDSVAYNIPRAVRLRGPLNVLATRQSLREIVNRHEALRTRFEADDGQPQQAIAEPGEMEMPVWDISGLEQDDREQLAREISWQHAHRPFDLEQGPVWRTGVVRLGAEHHALALCIHHVVSDAWSMGVLVKEFTSLYEGYREGRQTSLPDLPVQYADFAVWQREWLQGEVLEKQLSYWKRELSGLQVLELPTDRPRPALASHRGARIGFTLSPQSTERLKVFSRREGVTLFMTFLAAFQVVLGCYAGQDDVVVGTDVANRNRLETEGLIGFFVNQLVLRTDLSGNPTFGELLRRVRGTTLNAYVYQDLPFEKLVEELNPGRDLSRSPIFQVELVFQNAPQGNLRVAEVEFSRFGADYGLSKFDLTLFLSESQGGVIGTAEYASDLYEGSSIERLLKHLALALDAMAADSDRRIGEIKMLTESELQQAIVEWNDTEHRYSGLLCVHELFERQVEHTPDAVAVVSQEGRLSYRMLNEEANRLAHYLRKLGVGAEVRVALSVERSPGMLVALLAVLKAGGTYVPMDPTYPAERQAYLLEDARALALITQSHLRAKLSSTSIRCVELDCEWETISNYPETNPAVEISCARLAYVIYTSGSTGRPKGVMVTHGGLVNYLVWAGEAYRASECSGSVVHSSISFDLTITGLFVPLLWGKTVTLVEEMDAVTSLASAVSVSDSASLVKLTPGQLEVVRTRLTRENASQFAKVLVIGGEALRWDDLEYWRQHAAGTRLINEYGPTETVVGCCVYEAPNEGEFKGPVSIGRPIANTRVCVVDECGELTPVGAAGELCVGGAGVGRGYLNDAMRTAENFMPDIVSGKKGARLYRTGDQVRWRWDGGLEYLGRLDQQVKLRGYRIEPGEIEAVLTEHAAVRQCAVRLREDEPGERRLVAYLVESGEPTLSVAELREYLRGKLPEYMMPSAFLQLPELPLTLNGKLDLAALPVPSTAVPTLSGEGPRTPLEEILASIWARVLRFEQIGVHDNFFELGGHSLVATQVISRIGETLQIEVPLRALFESPTVAELARVVEEERLTSGNVYAPPILPVNRERDLPLSFAQQRLWFIHQLEPDSAVYNIPLSVRLGGTLDVSSLQQSLQQIVRRHEMLRTRFELKDDQTVQVIDEPGNVELPLWDLSDLSEGDRQRQAREIAARQAIQPFDLQQGPLWRAALLRLSSRDHVLLLCMHHVVSDGWSTGVLIREFTALYAAFRASVPPPLAELSIQYADFAVWQRQWLQEKALDQQLSYWRRHLAGLPILELPTDRPRPAVASHRGARVPFRLSAELGEQLRELSRREGVTLFMTLMAGFQLLLARYTGQKDIAVGTPIAGRNRAEIEALIGFFVNTLVMRTDFTGNPIVSGLLRRVREAALDAYAHQDLPFERLVEELQPERSLSHEPLFQVMMILQNAPRTVLEQADGGVGASLDIRDEPLPTDTAKFDLTLSVAEADHQIGGYLEYATDLYDRRRIERLLGQFRRLLEAMVADSQSPVMDITLLTENERQQVMVEWNDTARHYRQRLCVHELFENQARRGPDVVTVMYEEQQLSYAELNHRANQVAHYLRRQGARAEERVGICVGRSLEMVTAMLGVLKAGGAYLPLDPNYPPDRVRFMLDNADVRILLTAQGYEPIAPGRPIEKIYIDTDWNRICQECASNPYGVNNASNLAYVIYTSGSTGHPKGVSITHENAAAFLNWAHCTYPEHLLEGVLASTSICFDLSVFELFLPLCFGGRIVLAENALALSKLAAREEVTLVNTVPSAVQGLLNNGNVLSSARTVNVAGEALSGELVGRLYENWPVRQVYNLYGPTETTTYSTFTQVARDDSSPSIGRPTGNTQIYLLDERLQPVPVGAVGKLCIAGAGLARGYLNRPDLTADSFLPNPFGEQAGSRLYGTGDLGRYREGGNIEYLGRIDHQVKVRGYRIELGEIESTLGGHDGVRQCAVSAREDEPGSKRLVAYVVPSGKTLPSGTELRQYLQGKLPEFMVPWVFVQMDQLPLTTNGKLDRRALPRPELKQEDGGYLGPDTIVEEILCDIWSKVLGVEQVGVSDNFFELGGDSILSIQVIARAREAGVRLTPRKFFEHQTIAELARVAETTGLAEAEQQLLTGPVPLTPIQQAFFQWRLTNFHHFNQAVMLELKPHVDCRLLQQAVGALLHHHDALRLRFENREHQWVQSYSEVTGRIPFSRIDLSGLPDEERHAALQADAGRVQASLNLCEGSLVRAVEYDLGDVGRRLLLVIHHLAIDGVSWRILLEDLGTAYEQLSRGQVVQLPSKTTSFRSWAGRLQEYAQQEKLKQEVHYWLSPEWELVSAGLPMDEELGKNTVGSASTISVWLTEEETEALLQELPAAYHTQINDALLTAMAQAYRRWTGERSVLIEMEGHGREDVFEDVDLSRTTGWFTTLFPVRLCVDSEHPGEALQHVKEQLRTIPNRGLPYGVMRYLSRDTQTVERLCRLPEPQISFNYLGQFDQIFWESSLFEPARESPGPTRSAENHRRHLLDLRGMIVNGRMRIDWIYSENIHRRTTIRTVADYFAEFLRGLIEHCQSPKVGGFTPSDFPDADLTQDKLDKIIALLSDEKELV